MLTVFIFKPVTEQDLPLLFAWHQQPHVQAWWDAYPDWNAFVTKYQQKLASDWQKMFMVCSNDIPFGFIQYYQTGHDSWFDEPEGTVGIDQFIGKVEYLGRGYGTTFIKQFVKQFLQNPAIKQVITEVDPKNLRALRCYEKVGFKAAGHFHTHEGEVILMRYTNK